MDTDDLDLEKLAEGWGLLDTVSTVTGIAETGMEIAGHALDNPIGKQVLGPIGTAMSLADLGTGGYQLGAGIASDDPVKQVDGIHDLISGGAGIAGETLQGDAALYAKAFGAGFDIGDMIAPIVFGSEDDTKGTHTQAIPEGGVFKPSTGNGWVDGKVEEWQQNYAIMSDWVGL